MTLRLPKDAHLGWIVAEEYRVKWNRPRWMVKRGIDGFREFRRPDLPWRIVKHEDQIWFDTPEAHRDFWAGFNLQTHLAASFSCANGARWSAADKWGQRKRLGQSGRGFDQVLQIVPLTHASNGLRNDDGKKGMETNFLPSCQIEFNWYSGEELTPLEEEKRAELLSLILLWNEKYGTGEKLDAVPFNDVGIGSGSYGVKGAGRMSNAEWLYAKKDGSRWTVCEHQNVPSGNTHWDNGAERNAVICDEANVLLGQARREGRDYVTGKVGQSPVKTKGVPVNVKIDMSEFKEAQRQVEELKAKYAGKFVYDPKTQLVLDRSVWMQIGAYFDDLVDWARRSQGSSQFDSTIIGVLDSTAKWAKTVK